jgi:hypothetical protein
MKNIELDLERVERLIRSKSYAELSNEEKVWLSPWVTSSHEYETLRNSETKIRKYFLDNRISAPDPKILLRLTTHLKTNSIRRQEHSWWQLKPAIGVAGVAVIFGFAGWWIGQSSHDESSSGIRSSAVVRDTIYIMSKQDTIFSEKVIYRDRPIRLTRNSDQTKPDITPSQVNGINMKEKEELEKLLVSGTD